MINKIYILSLFVFFTITVNAQVVNVSQPFTSSQLLTPAVVGDGDYQQRIQSILRTQIIDGSNLYNTAVIGWDRKINNIDPDQHNYLGIGAQIVSDRLMNGLVQNNTINLNFGYHIFLDKDLENNLSIGLGGAFSQTALDKTNLQFGDQFYASGVSTGAGSMENLKSFPSSVSMNTGLLFTRHSQNVFLRMGASAFFFEKPQVTNSMLNASSGIRKLVFLNAEAKVFYDYTILVHAAANERNNIRSYIGGAGISFPITKNWEEVKRMYLGCSYRRGESIIPTISFLMEKYVLGFSYDVNNAAITGAQIKQTNFEISFSRSFGAKKADLLRTLFD